jgi:hypothetical protein
MGAPKPRGGMGFQDLEVFNIVLLAKQGWWLINSPNSLAARIMVEKYYPNSTFL